MIPVISQWRWKRWCDAKQLPVATSIFSLATCYYGLNFHSRPGTLLVTETELVHYSYSWLDTFWAIGEPSLKVSWSLASINEVRRLRLGFWKRLMQLWPESSFCVVTNDGTKHEFVLQQRGDQFAEALQSRGVSIVNEMIGD